MWTEEAKDALAGDDPDQSVTLVVTWDTSALIKRLEAIPASLRKDELMTELERFKLEVSAWLHANTHGEINDLEGSPSIIVTAPRAEWRSIESTGSPLDQDDVAVSPNSSFYSLG